MVSLADSPKSLSTPGSAATPSSQTQISVWTHQAFIQIQRPGPAPVEGEYSLRCTLAHGWSSRPRAPSTSASPGVHPLENKKQGDKEGSSGKPNLRLGSQWGSSGENPLDGPGTTRAKGPPPPQKSTYRYMVGGKQPCLWLPGDGPPGTLTPGHRCSLATLSSHTGFLSTCQSKEALRPVSPLRLASAPSPLPRNHPRLLGGSQASHRGIPAAAPSQAGVPGVGLRLSDGPGHVPPLSRASYHWDGAAERREWALGKLVAAADVRER